ncbi:MAG: proprotein convertase P-domain-containing protein [Sedimentisphaerales bacterium]|nr:proprotein convertase P-domain-containing protein [Sedimentisphaerales bacterium]
MAVGICICIFQYSAPAGEYYSFGRSVNKSFGEEYLRDVVLTEDIFIPVEGTIIDVDLALDIDHTCICDLQIYLRSPAGEYRCLFSYDWSNHKIGTKIPDFYWTVFDDESTVSINDGQSPFCGLYRPNGSGSLSDFYGQQSCGMWQVKVCDLVYGSTGVFKGVRLDFHIDTESSIETLSVNSTPEPSTGLLLVVSALITTLRRSSKPV